MGCSESTHVVEQKRKAPLEPVSSPFVKKKQQEHNQLQSSIMFSQIPERGDFFLIGSFNQKQQLFANVNLQSLAINKMSIPAGGFACHNFSSILQIEKGKYFISGGINHDLTSITNRCYFYFSKEHKVLELQKMKQPRYTHTSIHGIQQNSIYVFGGRYYGDDSEAILAHCQKYLIDKNEWVSLPSMSVKRCTCFAFFWNNIVYVLGGYTGPYQRSTLIEYLDEKQNKWKTLEVQLNRGLQGAIILPTNNNQITIFGGLTNSGPTDSVVTINLRQKSIQSRKKLIQKRSLYKGFYKNGKVYLLGGDDNFTCEIYDIINQKTYLTKKQFNLNLEDFDNLGFSSATAVVPYSVENTSISSYDYTDEDEVVYIFGTTQEPFVCLLNISIPEAHFRSVPMKLKLYAHQGGIFIDKNNLILFGGIEDDSLSIISSQTYFFNIKQNQAKKLAPMNQNRYAFTYQLTKGAQNKAQYIYCFGGATSNSQGQLVFLSACEKYSIKQNKWELIAPLAEKLISPMSIIFNQNIFVFGGTKENKQKSQNIFAYNSQKNIWTCLQSKLMFGIEAGSVTKVSKNQFYIFGGLVENGQSSGIWSLYFNEKTQNKKKETVCIFQEKGKMNEKKSQHKIYQPKNQDFYVVFGGNQDPLTFYKKNLEQQKSDLLFNIKEMFMNVLQQLNHKNLKGYLMTSYQQ